MKANIFLVACCAVFTALPGTPDCPGTLIAACIASAFLTVATHSLGYPPYSDGNNRLKYASLRNIDTKAVRAELITLAA